MMNRQPEQQTPLPQLVEFYEIERHLYELLLRLSEVQLDALKARAAPHEFVLLAERKESVLRSIERIERMVKPLKVRYVGQFDESDNSSRERLEHTLDEILALMDRIAANEEESRHILEKLNGRPRKGVSKHAGAQPAAFEAAARIRAQVQGHPH